MAGFAAIDTKTRKICLLSKILRGPVVPRFVATLFRGQTKLPFGMERWRTTSVRLPRRLARATLVNIFTDEVISPVVYSDVPWLLAGSAFQSWPVALLAVR